MEKQFQIPRPFCQCQLFRLHSNQQEQSSGTEERKLVRICLFFVSLQKGKKLTRQDWSWTEDHARGADYERRLKQWSRELSLRFSNLKFSNSQGTAPTIFWPPAARQTPVTIPVVPDMTDSKNLGSRWQLNECEGTCRIMLAAGELTAGRQYISLCFDQRLRLSLILSLSLTS